jgi:hypothetical protein
MTSLASSTNADDTASRTPMRPPSSIDVDTPSPAGMYDYYLGGKDNFAADRDAAEKALSVVPDGRKVAWANRRFLVRATRYLASKGIDQFIDLGTGIPTSPNVHETAKEIVGGARVAYVDNDPIVTVHNRALLESAGSGIIAVRGDIRYPLNVLANHAVGEVIDFSRPVGILFVAVLHFVTDQQMPYQAVAAFRDRIAPGSYIALSHITSDGTDPAVVAAIKGVYSNASAPAVFRSRDEILRFFTGFDLVSPGLVQVSEWNANNLKPSALPALRFLGGVGQKRRKQRTKGGLFYD